MTFSQLKHFLSVVDEGGFIRASERLHISQPALSYQIKQLELDFGTSLFHRGHGDVILTEAGRILYRHARKVIMSIKKARQCIHTKGDVLFSEIHIGTVNSVGIYCLPQVLQNIQEKFPETRPTITCLPFDDIVDCLLLGRLDLALVVNPFPDERLIQETVIEEQIHLVCGKAHPLFGKSALTPSDLQGMQLVSFTKESPTGQLIEEYLIDLQVNTKLLMHMDNFEMIKKMIKTGLGVAFLPDMVTSAEVTIWGNLWRMYIDPPLIRKIAIVKLKDSEKNRATDAFVREIRFHMSHLNGRLEDNNSGQYEVVKCQNPGTSVDIAGNALECFRFSRDGKKVHNG